MAGAPKFVESQSPARRRLRRRSPRSLGLQAIAVDKPDDVGLGVGATRWPPTGRRCSTCAATRTCRRSRRTPPSTRCSRREGDGARRRDRWAVIKEGVKSKLQEFLPHRQGTERCRARHCRRGRPSRSRCTPCRPTHRRLTVPLAWDADHRGARAGPRRRRSRRDRLDLWAARLRAPRSRPRCADVVLGRDAPSTSVARVRGDGPGGAQRGPPRRGRLCDSSAVDCRAVGPQGHGCSGCRCTGCSARSATACRCTAAVASPPTTRTAARPARGLGRPGSGIPRVKIKIGESWGADAARDLARMRAGPRRGRPRRRAVRRRQRRLRPQAGRPGDRRRLPIWTCAGSRNRSPPMTWPGCARSATPSRRCRRGRVRLRPDLLPADVRGGCGGLPAGRRVPLRRHHRVAAGRGRRGRASPGGLRALRPAPARPRRRGHPQPAAPGVVPRPRPDRAHVLRRRPGAPRRCRVPPDPRRPATGCTCGTRSLRFRSARLSAATEPEVRRCPP